MNDAMEILRNRSRETLEISESIRIINEEFNDAFETNEDHPAARVGDAADLAYKIAMLKSLEEIILQLSLINDSINAVGEKLSHSMAYIGEEK